MTWHSKNSEIGRLATSNFLWPGTNGWAGCPNGCPAFSQSDPSKFFPAIPTWGTHRGTARDARREPIHPQGSPTASCSLVQFQWEFIFANLPGGTPPEHFAINTGDGNAVDLQYGIHRSVFVVPWLAISEPQTQDWFVPKALVPNSTWLKDFESTTQTPHGNVSLTSWSWMLVVTLEHLNVENKRYPKTDLKYGHHIFI